MELYIQIKDGQPHEHPIFGENFRQAFPNIDTNNLPADFAAFERIEIPLVGTYQVYDGVTYEWDNGVVKDVHHVRDMTAEEKTLKQNKIKLEWDNYFPSWIFDEDTCSFVSPTPYPQDNKVYSWDEEALSWIEKTV